ncbi:prolyl oligopeptidase family serine peptidase [Roseateles sp. P5_E8]
MASCLRAAALALACLGVQFVQAAPPPAEVFFRDPDIAQALLSPSGKQLAFTSAKGASRVGLVVMNLADGKLMRVMQSAKLDVAWARWISEEQLLVGMADTTEGRLGASPMYAVNADGNKLRIVSGGGRRLLRVPEPRAGQANEEVLLSYDQSTLAHDLWVEVPQWVNTRTGQRRDFSSLAPTHNVQWLTDAQGVARATLTLGRDRVQAYWLPPGQSEWQQLFDTSVIDQPFRLESVDDKGTLYVSHVPKGSQLRVLARYDTATKAPAEPPLVRTPGFDFNGNFIQEAGAVLGVRATADSEVTVWLDERMKKFQAQVDQLIAGHLNHISCRQCGKPDMVALVHSHNDHDPGKYWLYQAQPPAGESKWRAVGRVDETVDPERMAGLDLQTITARDGRALPVWVSRPDNTQGPLPAVVLVHGGPWMRGVHWQWNAWPQFLASRGYVVIEPEFRGSTGYGDDHFRAGFKQWGQSMQNDVTDALRWAQKQGLASDKACIMGVDDYGGYSALMGLAKDPEVYRCGVAREAVADLERVAGGALFWPDGLNLARRLTFPEMVGDARRDTAMLAANSPINLAARIKAPVLLAYGKEGERMRDALTAAGHPPQWLSYDEDHGVLENRLDLAHRVEAFLAKHLGPANP